MWSIFFSHIELVSKDEYMTDLILVLNNKRNYRIYTSLWRQDSTLLSDNGSASQLRRTNLSSHNWMKMKPQHNPWRGWEGIRSCLGFLVTRVSASGSSAPRSCWPQCVWSVDVGLAIPAAPVCCLYSPPRPPPASPPPRQLLHSEPTTGPFLT